MDNESIFEQLPGLALEQIASYLAWDPLASTTPAKFLSQLEPKEKLEWLNVHRAELKSQIVWAGTPIFSYAMGVRKSYREIVIELAEQLKVAFSHSDSTPDIEIKIVGSVWKDTLSRLTQEQREQLLSQAETLAQKYAPGVGKEAGAFTALTAAQLSGFGVYLMGSTLLGAINSALGLGLAFGAFTGLSSLISLAIGPVGWAGLGLWTIRKLGAANYKKLLPVVILIAAERAAASSPQGRPEEATVAIQPPPSQKQDIGHRLHVGWDGSHYRGRSLQRAALKEEDQSPLPAVAQAQTQPTHPTNNQPHAFPADAIKKDVDQIAHSQANLRTPPIERPKASRMDKTIWNLKPENQGLHNFLQKNCYPEQHFLDMAPDQQDTVEEWYEEYLKREEGTKKLNDAAMKAAARESRQEANNISKRAREILKWRKHHEALLPNIVFHDKAVESLLLYDSAQDAFNEQFYRMNVGQVTYRDSIHDTEPTVYEVRAKYDHRIYCRPNGGSQTLVLLVGHKNTQKSDLDLLRGPLNSGRL